MMRRLPGAPLSRRTLLERGAVALALGVGHYALGAPGVAALEASAAADVRILHAALYLENEAITAYEAGAKSGLLSKDVLTVAAAFMGDHKAHRDGIAGVLKSLGETPEPARSAYTFGPLRTADDILRLAVTLESGAVTAYRTLASTVENKTVLNFAALVLADEVRHQTVLRSVLKLPTY